MSGKKQKKKNKKPKDRSGFNGPTIKIVECPACGKRRMQRPMEHKVTLAKYLSPDKQEERYVDTCYTCQYRYYQQDQEYKSKKVDIAKAALDKGDDIPDGASLEDAL